MALLMFWLLSRHFGYDNDMDNGYEEKSGVD